MKPQIISAINGIAESAHKLSNDGFVSLPALSQSDFKEAIDYLGLQDKVFPGVDLDKDEKEVKIKSVNLYVHNIDKTCTIHFTLSTKA